MPRLVARSGEGEAWARAVAAVAAQRIEGANILCPIPAFRAQLLCLAADHASHE
jgi:hypothetical protein